MPAPASLEDIRRGVYRPGSLPGLGLNYGTSYGANKADDQLMNTLFSNQEARRIYNPSNTAAYFGPGTSTTSSVGLGGFLGGLNSLLGVPGNVPSPTENEWGQRLARISKNPELDALNSKFLEDLASYSPNRTAARTGAATQMSRASQLGNQLTGVTNRTLGTLESDQASNRSVLDSFIQRYGAAAPQMDASTQSQTQVLDRFFAPESDPESLAAQQAGIRGRARTAEVDAILPQVNRAILAGQIRSGTSGVSRVNDINLKNTAMQLARDNAVRNAEREARDLASLTALQRSTAGLPQEITTTNLLRSKLPSDVRMEMAAREMGLTGQALQQALAAQSGTTANMAAAQNLENMVDPLNDLARRQAILGQGTNQFLANNFLSAAVPGQNFPISIPPLGPSYVPEFPAPDQYANMGDDSDLAQLLQQLMSNGANQAGPAPAISSRVLPYPQPTLGPGSDWYGQTGTTYSQGGSINNPFSYTVNPGGTYDITGNPYGSRDLMSGSPNPLYYGPGYNAQSIEDLQNYYQ